MREPFILFSDIAAGGVRAIVYLLLVHRLFPVRQPEKKGVIMAIGGIAFMFGILHIAGMPDVYRMVWETVWIAVCAGRFQKADAKMSLFIGIFYEIEISLWQFLLSAWSGILLRSPAFLDYGTGSGQAALWLFHGLLAGVALFVWKHPDMTGKEAFRLTSAIAEIGIAHV